MLSMTSHAKPHPTSQIDREASDSSSAEGDHSSINHVPGDDERQREVDEAQRRMDTLFDRDSLKNEWTPPRPPDVLGELLDSRFMLPVVLPSDPELLCASPGLGVDRLRQLEDKARRRGSSGSLASMNEEGRSASRASIGNRGALEWRKKGLKAREVDAEIVEWVDGGIRLKLGTPLMIRLLQETAAEEGVEQPAPLPQSSVLLHENGRVLTEDDSFTSSPATHIGPNAASGRPSISRYRQPSQFQHRPRREVSTTETIRQSDYDESIRTPI